MDSITYKPQILETFENVRNFSFEEKKEAVMDETKMNKFLDRIIDFKKSLKIKTDKIEEIIDARTSDAIALALRFNSPIFTYKNILDKAGIFLNSTNENTTEEGSLDSILSNSETSLGKKHKTNGKEIDRLTLLFAK